MTYFSAHFPVYVADCFVVETAETIHIAAECVHVLAELCGFRLDKDQAPASPIDILGDRVDFGPGGVTATLPESRRDTLALDLDGILAGGRLTPGQAAKIRGRMGFAQV